MGKKRPESDESRMSDADTMEIRNLAKDVSEQLKELNMTEVEAVVLGFCLGSGLGSRAAKWMINEMRKAEGRPGLSEDLNL